MRKIFFVDRNEKEDIPNQWRIGRKQSQKTKNIGTIRLEKTVFHYQEIHAARECIYYQPFPVCAKIPNKKKLHAFAEVKI